jgi:segregation and condensation protein B
MFYTHLQAHIEALLFASGEPLAARKMAEILEIPESQVELLVGQLVEEMDRLERGLTIRKVADGYQMCTKSELAPVLKRLVEQQESKLSLAAMETLSIIAFKQPITKPEIEGIRGVKIDRVLSNLLERQLIKELGRKEALGRPILYGTTDEFLKCLGLNSLKDLPPLAELMPEAASE